MAKIMKLVLVAGLFILCAAKVNNTSHGKPGWMNMNELNEKIRSEPKPVIIDLYTNWCYWCKVMDKKTYTNAKVISYINDHFYAVKLDAETKDVVKWNYTDYHFNDNYKVNDFTMYATSGQPGFPTTVIFADEHSAPVSIAGFLTPGEMEPVLKYFGEGAYKKQNFTEFKSGFKSTW
jgi:thioredoxin-related protein